MSSLPLPEAEGASIPLGQRGEVGFRHDHGLLVRTGSCGMAGWLRQKLGHAIVRGSEPARSVDGSARAPEGWVRLRLEMRSSVPLGALGQCVVEAA